jgi:hypothetical protein
MRLRWWLLVVVVGVMVALAPVSLLQAGEEKKAAEPAKQEKKAEAPAAEKKAEPAKEQKKAEAPAGKKEAAKAEKPAGLVGTIVAVLPENNTLVVDVPHGKDYLRVGGMVTGKTRITIGGKKAALENLTWGQKVRINFRRVETGTELLSVEALDQPKP